MTYALMGPFMAIIRPIAAIFTAAFTGLFVNAFDVKDQSNRTIPDFVSQPIPLATLETTQRGG